MPDKKIVLITGRSVKQGVGISIGKELAEYQEATTILEVSQTDMTRLGLNEGDTVRLKSRHGEATVRCRPENLPEGMVFMAFGTTINQLIGSETSAAGTPDSKGIEVELEKIPV
ncbi:MAG: molybdopterin dinucleotide binding domain-containing protein [Thermodesulfobacteriota bacterium]|jgi:formylmethanofuran dehydrogenase subunit D